MGQLRPFKSLTNTAGISVFAYPCTLANMDGTLVSGNAGFYLQLFDKASAPSANDVPIASYYISAAGPTPLVSIFQDLGPIIFALGLAVGISTTHEKYAAATATYDVFGEIEEGLQSTDAIGGLTIAGDTTTHVDSLAVWNDGDNSNNNKLFRVRATNVSAGDRWLMITVTDPNNPADGSVPCFQRKLATGESVTLYFGPSGYRPMKYQTATAGATVPKVIIYGCILVSSSTGGTQTVTSAGDMTLEASYKQVSSS